MIDNVGLANVGLANKINTIGNGAAMSTYPTLTPQVIGQAEKTLNAILYRLLAGPGLTEAQWITLTLTAGGAGSAGRGQLLAKVAHGLKVDEAQAAAHIAGLSAAHLGQDPGDGAPGRPPAAEEAPYRQSGRQAAQ